MTPQKLYAFCLLFETRDQFDRWVETLTDQEREEYWPTMDHWFDSLNAVEKRPGGSTRIADCCL